MSSRSAARNCLIALGALIAFASPAAAQASVCNETGKLSAVAFDSLQTIARRLYADVRGTPSTDSVMVIALVLDSQCRLLHNAKGVMKVPYSTMDAFNILFTRGEARGHRAAGMMRMQTSDQSARRTLVFGFMPETVTTKRGER